MDGPVRCLPILQDSVAAPKVFGIALTRAALTERRYTLQSYGLSRWWRALHEKFHAALLLAALSPLSPIFAGPERSAAETLDALRFEITAESAYLRCVFGNPNSYEIGAEFVSARIR
jgi:hypothetical protein